MVSRNKTRGESIRAFILEQAFQSPWSIPQTTAAEFNISRQAVNKHVRALCAKNVLTRVGKARATGYRLATRTKKEIWYKITPYLAEDVVWTKDIQELFEPLKKNIEDICLYGFTEIFNNAIDHSEGTEIKVSVIQTAISSEIRISDNGLGIFKKIHEQLELLDIRHAVLELAKGKLTTDPERHTGEGIFFTSRMFDNFVINSSGIFFSHRFGEPEDWIMEINGDDHSTDVVMQLHHGTNRTTKEIFDKFTDEDFGFTKTVVPVRMARYGHDQLISRSQAKRLLARVDRFKTVIFDFSGVDTIGRSFADEIFRVFETQHPDIRLLTYKENETIDRMIKRVRIGDQISLFPDH